jgi:hypothetical protein
VNSTNVKATPAAVALIELRNNRTSTIYMKLYNLATTPTVGTTVPVATIEIPASTFFEREWPVGLTVFTAGLGYGFTTAQADNSTAAIAAGDVTSLNIYYS